jgi:hypothetical protein
MWTVEWFDDQKQRQLTETSSTCQIALAQPFAPREQHEVKKRKRDVDRPLATDCSVTQDATSTSENQNQPIELGVNLDVKVIDQEREQTPFGRALHSKPTWQKRTMQAIAMMGQAPSPWAMGSIGFFC